VLARQGLLPPTSLATAAMLGSLAAGIVVLPLMITLIANWDNAEALARLGALYLHNPGGLREAGAVNLAHAARMKPANAHFAHLQAMASALTGDQPAAEAHWRRHLELEPASVEPLVGQAMVHLRNGEVEAAIPLLETALRRRPKHPQATSMLALALHRSGDLERAIGLYERALPLTGDPMTLTRQAQAQLDAGRPKLALTCCNEAIDEFDSPHARTRLVRARAYLALGRQKKAEADFREAYDSADEYGLDDEARADLEAMGLRVE
jgi:tetratricopeptide (TPR) repeat protein